MCLATQHTTFVTSFRVPIWLRILQIYERCIPDVKEKLKLKSLEVIGLLIGARGTLTKFFLDFCKKFKINNVLENFGIEAIKGECKIYNNHI